MSDITPATSSFVCMQRETGDGCEPGLYSGEPGASLVVLCSREYPPGHQFCANNSSIAGNQRSSVRHVYR